MGLVWICFIASTCFSCGWSHWPTIQPTMRNMREQLQLLTLQSAVTTWEQCVEKGLAEDGSLPDLHRRRVSSEYLTRRDWTSPVASRDWSRLRESDKLLRVSYARELLLRRLFIPSHISSRSTSSGFLLATISYSTILSKSRLFHVCFFTRDTLLNVLVVLPIKEKFGENIRVNIGIFSIDWSWITFC